MALLFYGYKQPTCESGSHITDDSQTPHASGYCWSVAAGRSECRLNPRALSHSPRTDEPKSNGERGEITEPARGMEGWGRVWAHGGWRDRSSTVQGEGVHRRVGDCDDGDAVRAHLHGGGALGHLLRRRQRAAAPAMRRRLSRKQSSGWFRGSDGFWFVWVFYVGAGRQSLCDCGPAASASKMQNVYCLFGHSFFS